MAFKHGKDCQILVFLFISMILVFSLFLVIRLYPKEPPRHGWFLNDTGTDVILTTIPYNGKFSPGSEVDFKIGVRKTAEVDTYNYFALCIGTIESMTCKTPSGADPVAVGLSGIQFKFWPVIKISNTNQTGILSLIMSIPADAKPGIYGFTIYVCPVENDNGTCSDLSSIYGESDFIVEIK